MTDLKWDLDQLTEPFLHPVFVPGCVVAQDQVEARLEVTLSTETIALKGGEDDGQYLMMRNTDLSDDRVILDDLSHKKI